MGKNFYDITKDFNFLAIYIHKYLKSTTMRLEDLTEREKNELVAKYEPLVNKLTRQFSSKASIAWNDIKSMAYEGLVIAIEKYDEQRSSLTFMQYAAWSIRNRILTSLDNEARVVKLSAYAQEKLRESGQSTYNQISIDRSVNDDNTNKLDAMISENYEITISDEDSEENVFKYLYNKIEEEFSIRDCMIFYKSFGLKDVDEPMKGKDIAKEFGISEAYVSIRTKKIINWIRADKKLSELLHDIYLSI